MTLRRERPTASDVFTGSTDPFPLTGTSRRITNRDLACEECDVGIEHAEVSNEFEDLVAQSCRFPADSYVVVVRVLTPQGLELDRGEVRIQLVNPTRIEPVSPGRPFGETPQIVTTPNPRFLWSADAGVVSGGGTYRIRVVPVDGAASAEDAVEGFASWEATTNAPTALYPGSVSAIEDAELEELEELMGKEVGDVVRVEIPVQNEQGVVKTIVIELPRSEADAILNPGGGR